MGEDKLMDNFQDWGGENEVGFDLLDWQGGDQSAQNLDTQRFNFWISKFQSLLQNLLEFITVLGQLITAVQENGSEDLKTGTSKGGIVLLEQFEDMVNLNS